jgi:predicted DCC family thiol-disulfide oxidoreductase YuxK
LILYDGVCGLCHGFVAFVLQHDAAGVFRFASLQSEVGQGWLGRFGADRTALEAVHVVTAYQSDSPGLLSKSSAAVFVVAHLGAPWHWLGAVRVIPTALLDRLYDVGATHRYRLFGRYERCPAPAAGTRSRFLDTEESRVRP